MNLAVLVSGGVDSSVALHRLAQQGHTITAFYLKIWLEDELSFLGNCPWEEDLSYIQPLCDSLDIPLEVVPLQKEYHQRVVAYTIDEVRHGRTPNPDMLCNREIKFGAFYEAYGRTFDAIATGHYAQIKKTATATYLMRAVDKVKDQTYFLAHLNQQQITHALFPIGNLEKTAVRSYADQYQLPASKRKDSQGICFLGKFSFDDFLRAHLGTRPGAIIEFETGKKLGQHDGFWYHTIGQRRGLRLSGGPWYVVAKNPQENIIYVSNHYFDADKPRNHCTVASPHWIADVPLFPATLRVKLRHGEFEYQATVTDQGNGRLELALDRSDQGIAPGQFAVFYDNDVCLGCAILVADADKS